MDIFDLTGKVAIVTGGNGGLGLGIAKGLASEGCAVALVGRNQTKIDAAVAEMTELGYKSLGVQADVSKEDDVNRMVKETAEHFGRVDILVNNAAISWGVAPEKLTLEQWNEFIAIDLTSCFLCSKACYPEFIKAGGGKIINIGSMMSIFGASYAPAYAASKGGIVQFTRSIAVSWAADNIQANTILPGWIDTDLTKTARSQIPGLNENVLNRTPAKRWGNIGDLAGAAVFLASSASDFVTGTAIPVDGGYSVQ